MTTRNASEAPAEADQEVDFEKTLAELEAIVERLERGDLSLDESLKQFERGIELTRRCQGALSRAEQKVEILLRRPDAGPDAVGVAPFDPEPDR